MGLRADKRITTMFHWLVVASSLAFGCATIGGIPPSTFQFYEVIPYKASKDRSEGAGWKVAQVNVLLGQISRGKSVEVWCDIEVGVPQANHLGRVTDETAQWVAAEASDAAAAFALRRRKKATTSAELCRMYRVEMGRRMNEAIPGAKVDKFLMKGIRQTSFAPEPG